MERSLPRRWNNSLLDSVRRSPTSRKLSIPCSTKSVSSHRRLRACRSALLIRLRIGIPRASGRSERSLLVRSLIAVCFGRCISHLFSPSTSFLISFVIVSHSLVSCCAYCEHRACMRIESAEAAKTVPSAKTAIGARKTFDGFAPFVAVLSLGSSVERAW